MSKASNPTSVRNQLSKELLSLLQVLNDDRTGVIVNPQALSSAANQVKRDSKSPCWGYEIAGFQLKVDIPQNVLPTKCGEWLDILINLDIGGICETDGSASIDKLILNLEISTNTKNNTCSWHFDRHIIDNGMKQKPPLEAHPLYHFQHGGHAMKPLAQYLGNTLLLPAPRLAFPPMDAILSLDFVLSNFAGECWQQLRDDSNYSRLLRDSQTKHWRPYIKKLASWWDEGPKKLDCLELWPHLI